MIVIVIVIENPPGITSRQARQETQRERRDEEIAAKDRKKHKKGDLRFISDQDHE